ncbi:MAG: sugar phosphate isomerase/epimerase [Candidatus Omnitrophota bacterium]|jgi:sugar phosphate isomerase/epimerase|nr:MAG: sugar phosphate isomerase/epimerase [Candidatus Omnitrophota bacterium]
MSNRRDRREFLKQTMNTGLAVLFSQRAISASSEKETWQIGCFTRPWDRHDYRVALDAIAEAGFKYAGLMTCNSKTRLVISIETTAEDAHQIGAEVKQRGLKVPSVYGGGIPVQQSQQAGIDGLRTLIDHCAVVESQTLMMGGIESREYYESYYKAIAECCDYAESKKVGIILKPHGGLNADGPQCRKSIEKVGHRNFTLWYDPGNIYYYSDGALNPVDDAMTVDGLVSGMCIKDYLAPKNVNVTPGSGLVNFPAVFSRLQDGGFTRGPLVIETLAGGDLQETLAQAKQARQFVESLIA